MKTVVFFVTDKNPSKAKREVDSPLIATAEAIAVGPGTTSIGMSFSMHKRTKSSPGSEMHGIPASETTAQLSPDKRRFTIFSETCLTECS